MSSIKNHLEQLSVEIGHEGEINEEVCTMAFYLENHEVNTVYNNVNLKHIKFRKSVIEQFVIIIIFIVLLIAGLLAFCQKSQTNCPKYLERILYEKDGMKIRELAMRNSPYGSVRIYIAEKGDDWQMAVK